MDQKMSTEGKYMLIKHPNVFEVGTSDIHISFSIYGVLLHTF